MDASKEQRQSARNQKSLQREAGVRLAEEILARHDLATIRAQSLSDLDRWKASGVWCVAYDEWREILTIGSDEDLIRSMTGMDEKSVWLRTSAPYVGLQNTASAGE